MHLYAKNHMMLMLVLVLVDLFKGPGFHQTVVWVS